MRRFWMIGVVAVIAIGAAALFMLQRPLTVPVVKPETAVPIRIYGLGTVEARVLSRIGFEAGAALSALSADAGDRVTEGQQLAVLHSLEQEARVARAEAALTANAANLEKAKAAVDRARATLAQRQAANERQQNLARRDVASTQRAEESQRDEDVARADVAVAEAELALVRAQGSDAAAALRMEQTLLEHHRLLAPFDAVIVARHAEPGTVVKAGDPIFTLIDPSTIWIQAYIDEERAGQLAVGQRSTIRLRSQPQQVFNGVVARIGLESDRVNEERRVWLTCSDCPDPMYLGEQAEVRIVTGEQAEVRIVTGERASALMVPEVAISGFDGHRGRVWLVREGRLTQADLAFGARDDRGRVEVLDGVPDGAFIVALPPKGVSEGRRTRLEDAP